MAVTFEFRRGATIALVFEAVGDASALATVTAASAVLKPAVANGGVPGPDVAPVATFLVTSRQAAAGVGPGWDLAIAATDSAALPPGTYVTNMVLTYADGAIEVSDAQLLRIEQSTV